MKFGRLVSRDDRDKQYLISSLLPMSEPTRPYRYWYDNYWWGDQGNTPQCVGYAWTHYLADGPVTHGLIKMPPVDPSVVYTEAQKVDEWPGEDYEGTSVRAGAKVLVRMGFVSRYAWAYDLDTVVRTVLQVGPVVIGVNWYAGMMQPNKSGYIKPTGTVEGGHCTLINGVNKTQGFFRIKNSWGREWGNQGHALITFADFARLLSEDGEACLATETSKTAR